MRGRGDTSGTNVGGAHTDGTRGRGNRTARRGRATRLAGLAALGALLCAALTACTDHPTPTTASSNGPGATAAAHRSSTPAPSGSPIRPGASAPGAGHGSTGASPTPTGTLTGASATPAGAAPSTLLPSPSSAPGTPTHRNGPADDGGEDARVFCSPTALSFVLRVADPPRGAGAARPGTVRTDATRTGAPRLGADVHRAGDAVLVARNTSGHTCVLRGLPTLTITDDAGHLLITATRARPYTQPFALHPGAGGVAGVHYAARRGCRGTAARVTLPGSGAANSVPVLDGRGRPATLSVCGPTVRIGQFTPGFG